MTSELSKSAARNSDAAHRSSDTAPRISDAVPRISDAVPRISDAVPRKWIHSSDSVLWIGSIVCSSVPFSVHEIKAMWYYLQAHSDSSDTKSLAPGV